VRAGVFDFFRKQIHDLSQRAGDESQRARHRARVLRHRRRIDFTRLRRQRLHGFHQRLLAQLSRGVIRVPSDDRHRSQRRRPPSQRRRFRRRHLPRRVERLHPDLSSRESSRHSPEVLLQPHFPRFAPLRLRLLQRLGRVRRRQFVPVRPQASLPAREPAGERVVSTRLAHQPSVVLDVLALSRVVLASRRRFRRARDARDDARATRLAGTTLGAYPSARARERAGALRQRRGHRARARVSALDGSSEARGAVCGAREIATRGASWRTSTRTRTPRWDWRSRTRRARRRLKRCVERATRATRDARGDATRATRRFRIRIRIRNDD
ncbi:predicted protein, partial [Ostreococcus lucimarinus CCE9901]